MKNLQQPKDARKLTKTRLLYYLSVILIFIKKKKTLLFVMKTSGELIFFFFLNALGFYYFRRIKEKIFSERIRNLKLLQYYHIYTEGTWRGKKSNVYDLYYKTPLKIYNTHM